jgi:hypothetical protein
MLRTNFSKGMTNLTMFTADKQAGIALTIFNPAQTDKGREAFEERFDDDDTPINQTPSADPYMDIQLLEGNIEDNSDSDDDIDEEAVHGHCTFSNFVEILEVLLSFHAWYKSDPHATE